MIKVLQAVAVIVFIAAVVFFLEFYLPFIVAWVERN